MCTAYKVAPDASRSDSAILAEIVTAMAKLPSQLIRPTLSAPVLMPDQSLRIMSWGFGRVMAGAKKPVARTIVNSCDDKLAGRTCKKAFAERRCLIPASSFFEWINRPAGKVPLEVSRPGEPLLWIAGIWEENREHWECFSMITTEPNSVLEPVHDRMPAVLADPQVAPYLAGELNEFGSSSVLLGFSEGRELPQAEAGSWNLSLGGGARRRRGLEFQQAGFAALPHHDHQGENEPIHGYQKPPLSTPFPIAQPACNGYDGSSGGPGGDVRD